MSNNLFKKRVYGVVIVKSKLANYNADFTGAPRTLPDGTVYATDKVLKFKIRDYFEKSGKEIFVKTKYKENGNPMTLEEVYKYHFKEDAKDKIITLKNLLSMLDVRLFGVTFAKKGDNNLNLSIHGPVQISYGVNRFTEMKDSGMFTDQIGSQFASKEGDSQTTLGTQTRSFEAHYVHHFSINPKNLEQLISQIGEELINRENIKEIFIKLNNKKLDKEIIKKRINVLLKDGRVLLEKLSELGDNKVKEWSKFLEERMSDIKFKKVEEIFCLLSNKEIKSLKDALKKSVSYYDSTSKKDVENEFLMWVELNENTDIVLRNFSELIKITKEDNKTKIDLSDVFKYLENFKNDIEKVEIYYDEEFTQIEGIQKKDGWDDKINEITKLGLGEEHKID